MAHHMQHDTTHDYVQWLRRGGKEMATPATPKHSSAHLTGFAPGATDCSTPTSGRKTSRSSTRCATSLAGQL
jgi:hypothetical protein